MTKLRETGRRQSRVWHGRGFVAAVGDGQMRQPDYVVRVDEKTGLLVRDPCLSDEELAIYYARNDWRIHCSHRLFPTELALRAELLKRLPPRAKVLDIGCGDGRLLQALPEDYRKFGTELSAGAAESSVEKGIRIVAHEDVVGGVHGDFDAVVMVDVFEHLKEPHGFLRSVLPRLKIGGLLGIATGDGDFPAVREDAANFWYFRVVSHVCMWTEDYARFAERELGIERVSVQRCSHYHFEAGAWARQALQKMAFDTFHLGKHAWLRPAAGLIPGLRRARHWTSRPPYWHGRDHVVTVFRKREGQALPG